MPLHIVPPSPPPDTPAERVRKRLRAAAKPADMLQCPRCAGREVLVTVTGATIKGGRVSGGTKTWVCANCHRKGERVVLV